MKSFFISMCAALVFLPCLPGQDVAPSIVFDNLVRDFGKVMEGDTLTHVFKFENKGTALLDILSVEASCGCTGTLLSSKQVKPGQAGQIEVSVKTEGFGGMENLVKTVNVTTNDPRQKQMILSIKASVEPEFALSARTLYLGEVPVGKEASKEITITIAPGRDLKVIGADSSDPSVSVRLEPVAGSNGKKIRLIAKQNADVKEGYHFGTVTVRTSSKQTPEVKISVRGIVTTAQNK
jgi:hypothetical protein